MALSFPREMPDAGPSEEAFEPERLDFLTPEAGGRLGAATAGFPVWRGEWTLGRAMTMENSEAWRAFAASLRGPQRLFYGRDYGRPLPLRYPGGFAGLTRAGGGAFDGTASSWSVNGTRDVLTLNGLPAGFEISIGDYVMLRWTTSSEPRRALVRAVEAAAASGAGVAPFSIEPPLPALVPGSAVADLDRPCCLMRLIPSETSIGAKDRRLKVTGRLAARQELLP